MANRFPYPNKRETTLQRCFVSYKLTTATAAALGTTNFCTNAISDMRIDLTVIGGETAKLTGLIAGSATFVDVVPILESTGNPPAAPTALVTGVYRLPLAQFAQFRQIKCTKSAAVQSGTCLMVQSLANTGQLGYTSA